MSEIVRKVAGSPASPADGLLRLIAEGDPHALDQLYDLLHVEVYRVALSVVRDRMLAEDVVQDVFEWVWRSATRYDPRRGTPRAWIITITRRRAIDAVRRESTWRKRSALDVPGEHEPFNELVSRWDRDERMRLSLVALTELQRDAVTLAFFGECTYVQAAERLDVKLSTFKTRVRDGLLAMRSLLADVDEPAV